MIRYLTLREALEIHRSVMELSRGAVGVRDLNRLRSALAQPRMTFDGKDLYPGMAEKAAALGFSIIKKPPVRGWKQAGRSRRYGNILAVEWV